MAPIKLHTEAKDLSCLPRTHRGHDGSRRRSGVEAMDEGNEMTDDQFEQSNIRGDEGPLPSGRSRRVSHRPHHRSLSALTDYETAPSQVPRSSP